MTLPDGSVSASFQLGAKGRAVLPAAVRRAAHIPEGAIVIAHSEGVGRIVIETTDAIRARVWRAAPESTGVDATVNVRAMRDEDVRRSDEAADRRSAAAAGTTDAASDEAGARLLAHLGL